MKKSTTKPAAKRKPAPRKSAKPAAVPLRWYAVVIEIPATQILIGVEESRSAAKNHVGVVDEIEVNYGGDWLTIPCRTSIRPADVLMVDGEGVTSPVR